MNDTAAHVPLSQLEAQQALDLDIYPMHCLDSAQGVALLLSARAQFAQTGLCSLPGFVRPPAAAGIVHDLQAQMVNAFYNRQQHNVYFQQDDPNWAVDHPARVMQRTAQKALAGDQIPAGNLLSRIYRWQPLQEFLAQVLNETELNRLHPHTDPLACLNVMRMDNEDELGWHYDRSDFATTLLLQAPEAGGEYWFVPFLREAGQERLDELGQVLDGSHPRLRQAPLANGTLSFFAGRHSPHRVTKVQGHAARIMAVLGYVRQPGALFNAAERQRFYGRSQVMDTSAL